MVVDPPQSEALTAKKLHTVEPVKFSSWPGSRVLTEEIVCDVKSIAARRKRTEIRRLRLMAANYEENDIEQPPEKKLRIGLGRTLQNDLDTVAGSHNTIPGGQLLHERARESISDVREVTASAGAGGRNIRDVEDELGTGLRLCVPAGSDMPMDEQDSGDLVPGRIVNSTTSGSTCPSHCVMSICGRRREMEDAAIAVPSFLTLPSADTRQSSSDTFHFFGVYDGHGGAQAANFCKERLHGVLAEEISASGNMSPSQWTTSLKACFQKVDAELCGICPHGLECPRGLEATTSTETSTCRDPLVHGSVGTTAVVAVVSSSHLVVGNCGDSRAVLSRGGQVVPLSFDHKADRPDEVARIEAAGGCVFSWEGHRVCGVLAMSRALGDRFLKPYVIAEPEVTCIERTDDDECLILASDGLWDVLSNEYVCSVARKALANWRRHQSYLRQHHTKDEQDLSCDSDDVDSPSHVVAALLTKLALAKKSKDNISVVVVDLKRLGSFHCRSR